MPKTRPSHESAYGTARVSKRLMSALYLGVDGGQSSTTLFIADETGRVIGAGQGGPCNHLGTAEGRAKFFAAIGQCLNEACREAHLDPNTVAFRSACLGFSGGSEDKESFVRELIRSAKFKITHDAEIALSGATAGQPGIIIIAGTGSMAFGRNSKSQTARAGGWGYVFGDEGGAFDLTRRALRAALQFEEGWGRPTVLRETLLEASGALSVNDLLHRFYTPDYSRTTVASLAPLITRAAEHGDEIALEILQCAAQKLARFVEGVYGNLFAGESVPVAHLGGVFQSALLRAAFADRILKSIGCRAGPPRLGPAAGAILEALRLDGNPSELSNVPESEK